MAIQTVAGVETERLQRAWQDYYRARRRVRQAKNAGKKSRCRVFWEAVRRMTQGDRRIPG
jgi:hypothetical protein